VVRGIAEHRVNDMRVGAGCHKAGIRARTSFTRIVLGEMPLATF